LHRDLTVGKKDALFEGCPSLRRPAVDPFAMSANGRRPRTRVLAVIGTRPEAIKMFSPVERLRARDDEFETIVCSTGQHDGLLTDALGTLGLAADHHLGAMRPRQQPDEIAWLVAAWVSDLCRREQPDVILVQGDTTTAMAAGLAGFYSPAVLAHVEAGLRTYDNRAPWPEEAHRRVLGAVADLHFAPSELAAANLIREGVAAEAVHVTGNTGIDALRWALAQPRTDPPPPEGERRVVITAHRRESIPDGISAIARAVRSLAAAFPDVRFQFVVHPAPSIGDAVTAELAAERPENVDVLPPRDYVTFVRMLADSTFIITDSGGVQEEAPALGRPVLVVNHRTAREEPLTAGTAVLVGTNVDEIVGAATRLLRDPDHYARMAVAHDPYGDGRAGERIADLLAPALRLVPREVAVGS
jgi:UDP-N-acetylglucosamine 2-epimerase (non-hydrolysing)